MDACAWFDETNAVTPRGPQHAKVGSDHDSRHAPASLKSVTLAGFDPL
jgi:hypothetical protein